MGIEALGSRAIIGKFFARLQQDKGVNVVNRIARLMDSDQSSETYEMLSQSPALREWIGGRHAKGLRENNFTIENKHFEATMDILCKWIRRDKTGQINIRIDEMVERAQSHWLELLSTLITNGTGSTSGYCYDGHVFFDTDHSEGDSGTQLNLLAAAQVAALNVATAAAPTPSEAISAILGVIAYMLNYKDDQGKPMNDTAKNFLIMTSPILWARLAPAILNSQVTSGETNVIKALAAEGFNVSIVPNAQLAYTTQFVTFRTDAPAAPFIIQQETPLEMKSKAEGSDYEFDNDAWQFGIDTWRNAGYGLWQYAAHATLE